MKELKSKPKTSKVAIRTLTEIKELMEKDESFNDVIENFIYHYKKTKIPTNQNGRIKKIFIKVNYNLSLECNYHYIKRYMKEFIIGVSFCKIMTKRRMFNPSFFFGLCSEEKYYSKTYMSLYLKTISLILEKELKIKTYFKEEDYFNEQKWIDLYNLYKLSKESLEEDILVYLRKMKKKPNKEITNRINDSEMVKRGIK